jgi:thymidine phosphorylase
VLADGRAWRKFQEICEAQGGMREPPKAAFTEEITAQRSGHVIAIDNRRLARIAKLAGAPKSPCAGIELQVQHGEFVERGQPLFTLHAASPGALAYAADYALTQPDTLRVAEDV